MAIPLKLTVYRGSELIGEHRFERDIIKIGRLQSAHLKLDDPKVSRIHAVIEASSTGQDFSIIDMGSTEGTFINGEKVSKERVKDGDEIRLGDCRLLVAFEDAGERVQSGDIAASQSLHSRDTSKEELWQVTTSDLADTQATMTLQPSPIPVMTPHVASANVAYAGVSVVGAGGVAASGVSGRGASISMPPPPLSPDGQAFVPPQGSMARRPADAPVPASGPLGPAIPVMPLSTQVPMAGRAAAAVPVIGWGHVPTNLASDGVPESERALEIKTVWGDTVLDTVTATDQPVVTMGDERRTTGFGPFQRVVRCDIEVPSKRLPSQTFPLALSQSQTGTTYAVNIPEGFTGRLEKADGSVIPLEDLLRSGRGVERGDAPGVNRYNLNAAETLYLSFDAITLQLRYVRRNRLIPPGFWADMDYTWVNMIILAIFAHVLAIVSFIATPKTTVDLEESLFKNPNRFAQFRLTPEQKRKSNDMLAKLKAAGDPGAKAKGTEGQAGRKDYKDKKQGRMAVKGDPNDKEIAKSTLAKLFGAQGNTGRSYLFGSGGLGGELKGALGGVTGAEIGDAAGLGGLGVRGSGPGGGGLSMNSVGLGALGTHGRGGGQGGYGSGVGSLGKKAERDINISSGSPIIMGSLDKELIRRVIQEHIAQIRYCYEKELVRSPGLFGKIATQWTITAEGTVSQASVAQSTMNNDEVERCITSKIRTWIFPKPKGGGVVIVKYPFIFKTTG